MDAQLEAALQQEVLKVKDAVKAFRHQCHQLPERTWQEHETAARVAAELRKIPGLEVKEGVGELGVVALLPGPEGAPVVALRADMDALPLTEISDLPYKSQSKGTMHACGHDGHMANLLGAAKVLSAMRDQLPNTVKFIFQPAEEGGAGAKKMVEDGVLEAPHVDVIFGLHGWPEAPAGEVWVKEGAQLAANSEFKITITGTGCHGAMPHLGTDQVLIAARIIEGLQSISSRVLPPTEPVALTIPIVKAGTATNIIPQEVVLEGTLRTMSEWAYKRVGEAMRAVVESISAAHGATGTLVLRPIYPATINHPAPSRFVRDVAAKYLGEAASRPLAAPSMGAEDFSFYLEERPGCFFFLGLDDGREGGYPSLHHPSFDFNDDVLEHGIQLFVRLAVGWRN